MSEQIMSALIYSVVSGLVGGAITGASAFAAIRVYLKWLRADLDSHHQRLTRLEKLVLRRAVE